MRGLLGTAVVLAAMVGCAPVEEGASPGTEEAARAGATITFRADFTQELTGRIEVGQPVKVRYVASRLPGCRGTNMGRQSWGISGFAQVGSAAPTTFGWTGDQAVATTGFLEATFTPEREGELSLWFSSNNRWGCVSYDSNNSRNYRFTVSARSAPSATLSLTRDWRSVTDGTPRAGSSIVVNYDLARLPQCRSTYNGLAAWDVAMEYRLDGAASRSVSMTTVNGSERRPNPARIDVPPGTRSMTFWFTNTDRTGCRAYDSAFGRNYTVSFR